MAISSRIAQNTVDGPIKVSVASSGDPTQADPAKTIRFQMQHFVTTTGGEYFFQPSIEALFTVFAGQPSPFVPPGPPPSGPSDDDDPNFDPCADAIKEANAAAKGA